MRWRTGLVIAALGVAAALVAPSLLRRVSFFEVRRVELLGARYLTGEDVVEALGLAPDRSLFDRLDGLDAKVAAIPGVRAARVSRRWPGTLVVRVTEADPVALAPRDGVLVLMDDGGRLLPFDPTRAPADLPVAQADSAVARVLGRVREAEPSLYALVQSARRVAGDVVLESGRGRYLLRADAPVPAIRALAAVLRDLATRAWTFQELDARFTDRVFVRGMKT